MPSLIKRKYVTKIHFVSELKKILSPLWVDDGAAG